MRASVGRILFPARNAETLAWRAAVIGDGGSVANTNILRVDKFISTLKGQGFWAKFDRYWLFDAENSQSALRDLKAAALATAVSSPTFTAYRGFTGNGSSSYIDTGFNPTTAAGQYTQNSAHISARCLSSAAASGNNRLIGMTPTGTQNIVLIVRNTGDVNSVEVNDATAASFANATTLGHWIINRSASNARQHYLDGALLNSDTQASTGLLNNNVLYLNFNATFAGLQVASGSIGSSLSASEAAALTSAELTYARAVGAV